MLQIREIRQSDSSALAELMTTLARETPNSLLTESESLIAGESQAERIDHILISNNQRLLVAVDETKLVGIVGMTQGAFIRNKHVASLMIGLLSDYWGKGFATELFDQGMAWVKIRGVLRLEVGVLADNHRAIEFYTRHGFVEEGVKRNALLIETEYVNEVIMAKYLD